MMVLLIPLNAVLTIGAVLMFLGVGWATMIGMWLFEHALAVGIVLLIIHIIVSLGWAFILGEEHSIIGIICAVAHAIPPPFAVKFIYDEVVQSGSGFGFWSLVEFLLMFWCLSIIDAVWMKAINGIGKGSKIVTTAITILYVGSIYALMHIEG